MCCLAVGSEKLVAREGSSCAGSAKMAQGQGGGDTVDQLAEQVGNVNLNYASGRTRGVFVPNHPLGSLSGNSNEDRYFTRKSAWEDIKPVIDWVLATKGYNMVWEGFAGNGQSARFLRELGYTVHDGDQEDFFEHNHGDICITNPPVYALDLLLFCPLQYQPQS